MTTPLIILAHFPMGGVDHAVAGFRRTESSAGASGTTECGMVGDLVITCTTRNLAHVTCNRCHAALNTVTQEQPEVPVEGDDLDATLVPEVEQHFVTFGYDEPNGFVFIVQDEDEDSDNAASVAFKCLPTVATQVANILADACRAVAQGKQVIVRWPFTNEGDTFYVPQVEATEECPSCGYQRVLKPGLVCPHCGHVEVEDIDDGPDESQAQVAQVQADSLYRNEVACGKSRTEAAAITVSEYPEWVYSAEHLAKLDHEAWPEDNVETKAYSIECSECGRTEVLPVTRPGYVDITGVDGWTGLPIRCPECSGAPRSTEQSMLDLQQRGWLRI